jgi:Domain of unknown function (DUF397)
MQTMSAPWRKSSYSANGGQDCVEAGNVSGLVVIRDTKDREGAILAFPAGAWASFISSINNP